MPPPCTTAEATCFCTPPCSRFRPPAPPGMRAGQQPAVRAAMACRRARTARARSLHGGCDDARIRDVCCGRMLRCGEACMKVRCWWGGGCSVGGGRVLCMPGAAVHAGHVLCMLGAAACDNTVVLACNGDTDRPAASPAACHDDLATRLLTRLACMCCQAGCGGGGGRGGLKNSGRTEAPCAWSDHRGSAIQYVHESRAIKPHAAWFSWDVGISARGCGARCR